MATLSGQSIQNTYDGLLKLSDSITGITTTTQAVEDGLGNNTGLLIKQNQLWGGGIVNMNTRNLFNDFYGIGYNTTGVAPINVQNAGMVVQPFYDNGVVSYSALSINIITATTSSDILQWAFYTPQMVSGKGLAPADLVVSGICDPATIGVKTSATTFSFSGTGAGPYLFCWRIKNGGSNPTLRPSASPLNAFQYISQLGAYLGFTTSNSTNVVNFPLRSAGVQVSNYYSTLTGGFPSSFTSAQIAAATVDNLATVPYYGFVLHTIK